jgi:copper(I)-binding protein
MLEHPTQPLKVGSKLPLTFIFDGGAEVAATCQVKSASAID